MCNTNYRAPSVTLIRGHLVGSYGITYYNPGAMRYDGNVTAGCLLYLLLYLTISTQTSSAFLLDKHSFYQPSEHDYFPCSCQPDSPSRWKLKIGTANAKCPVIATNE
jgi:hypothetical protein